MIRLFLTSPFDFPEFDLSPIGWRRSGGVGISEPDRHVERSSRPMAFPMGSTSTRAILRLVLPPGNVLPGAAILAITTCDTGHGRKSSGPRLTSRQHFISESQVFLSLDVPVSSAIIAASPAALGLPSYGPGRSGGGHRISRGRPQGDNQRARTPTTSTSRRDGTCQGTQTRPQLAADRRSPPSWSTSWAGSASTSSFVTTTASAGASTGCSTPTSLRWP